MPYAAISGHDRGAVIGGYGFRLGVRVVYRVRVRVVISSLRGQAEGKCPAQLLEGMIGGKGEGLGV